MKNPLAKIHGKTIESADIVRHEASDGCSFITLELRFEDKSMYSFRIQSEVRTHGIFFKNEKDDDSAIEVELVEP